MNFLSKRILFTTVSIVVALSAIHIVSIYMYYDSIRSRYFNQTISELESIAKDNKDIYLANTILDQDKAIEMLNEEISSSRNLKSALWTCSDFSNEGQCAVSPSSNFKNGILELTSNYRTPSNKCCSLILGKSVQSVIASTEYKRNIIMLAGFAGILIIVIGTGIVITMRLYFTKPIGKIFNIIDQLANDKLDVESTKDKNEFGDITRQLKQLGKTIKLSRDSIARQSRMAAIGRMSSQIAHDMRSPLAVLNSYVNTTQISNNVEDIEFNHAAKRSIKKLVRMADDLIDYAKAGKIEKTNTDIRGLISETVIVEINNKAIKKNIKIRCDVDSNVLLSLDANKISRVLVNMVNNAIEAIHHNNGEIIIKTNISGSDCKILISDNGIGIENDHIPHIFDTFYTSGKKFGVGLGLSYAKQAIEAHGGTIEVQSEVGKGTTFTINIPCCVVKEPKQAVTTRLGNLNYFGRHFSIIDDDPDIRLRLKKTIEGRGGKVIWEAGSGEEVINNDELDFDAVDTAIVDYSFPGSQYNGADIIRHLRTKGISEIHLCTGFADDEEVQKAAYAAGAASVMSKDFI